jgi:hypothetical protein
MARGFTELKEKRKLMFAEMEQKLRMMCPKEEDSIFVSGHFRPYGLPYI